MKEKLLRVKFHDHGSFCSGVDAIEPFVVEAVGFLVHETKTHLILMPWVVNQNIADDNNEGYAILKSTILSRKALR